MWNNINIFKKAILTHTNYKNINIPNITNSYNWDENNLVFISGLKELNMLKTGKTFNKEEKKVSDLTYNITYKSLDIESSGEQHPNSNIFENTFEIQDSYYSFFTFRTYFKDKNNITLRFDIYRDNVYVETIYEYINYIDSYPRDWTPWTIKHKILHPDFKKHIYTFKNLSTSGTVDRNIKMYSLENFKPNYSNYLNMDTNIIFGENINMYTRNKEMNNDYKKNSL